MITVNVPIDCGDKDCGKCRWLRKVLSYDWQCNLFLTPKRKQMPLHSDLAYKNPQRCSACLHAEMKEKK